MKQRPDRKETEQRWKERFKATGDRRRPVISAETTSKLQPDPDLSTGLALLTRAANSA